MLGSYIHLGNLSSGAFAGIGQLEAHRNLGVLLHLSLEVRVLELTVSQTIPEGIKGLYSEFLHSAIAHENALCIIREVILVQTLQMSGCLHTAIEYGHVVVGSGGIGFQTAPESEGKAAGGRNLAGDYVCKGLATLLTCEPSHYKTVNLVNPGSNVDLTAGEYHNYHLLASLNCRIDEFVLVTGKVISAVAVLLFGILVESEGEDDGIHLLEFSCAGKALTKSHIVPA